RRRGLGAKGDDPAAVAGRVRGSAVKGPLLAALDDWAHAAASIPDLEKWTWLVEVAWRADPVPWRSKFRDPAQWRDRARIEKLAAEAKAEGLAPPTAVALAAWVDAPRPRRCCAGSSGSIRGTSGSTSCWACACSRR